MENIYEFKVVFCKMMVRELMEEIYPKLLKMYLLIIATIFGVIATIIFIILGFNIISVVSNSLFIIGFLVYCFIGKNILINKELNREENKRLYGKEIEFYFNEEVIVTKTINMVREINYSNVMDVFEVKENIFIKFNLAGIERYHIIPKKYIKDFEGFMKFIKYKINKVEETELELKGEYQVKYRYDKWFLNESIKNKLKYTMPKLCVIYFYFLLIIIWIMGIVEMVKGEGSKILIVGIIIFIVCKNFHKVLLAISIFKDNNLKRNININLDFYAEEFFFEFNGDKVIKNYSEIVKIINKKKYYIIKINGGKGNFFLIPKSAFLKGESGKFIDFINNKII